MKNLSALVDCGRYLQLSEATMASTLASNSLKGFSEMELYHIAREWLDHDYPNRRSSVYALLRHIRFPLMSRSELFQISQDDQEDGGSVMRSETACANLLLEACNYQMMPFMQPGLQTERTQIRSDATHIVVLGGVMRQQLVVSKELRLYDEKFEHWRALKAMEEPRYQHGVALLGGFLFIVGGQSTNRSARSSFYDPFSSSHLFPPLGSSGQSTYDTKGKTAIDSAYRYDPRFNKWLQIASLNEKRTFFHLSALAGKLFAVGGRNTSGEISKPRPVVPTLSALSACLLYIFHLSPGSDTVECYNMKKNEWTFVTSMVEPHYGHAGTVHADLMYISGMETPMDKDKLCLFTREETVFTQF